MTAAGGSAQRRDLAIKIATLCTRLRPVQDALLADTDPSSANDVRELAVVTLALGFDLIKYATDVEVR